MRKSMIIVRAGICLICLGLLLSSCQSRSEQTTPAKHIVEIKAMKFQPAELVVNTGDTVVWINRDIVAHDVTEEPGKTWASTTMPPGASWSWIVTESANYYCSIHVVMKGKLLVQ